MPISTMFPQFYFGNIIMVEGSHAYYQVQENAPVDNYSLLVMLVNPDFTIERRLMKLVLSQTPLIGQWANIDEFQAWLNLNQHTQMTAYRRLFSGE